MDMGIKGRKAHRLRGQQGAGQAAAPMALAGEGVDLVINARTKSELEATAEAIRRKYGVKVTAVAVDVTTRGGPQAGARRLSRARHPRQQCRRPAAGRLP